MTLPLGAIAHALERVAPTLASAILGTPGGAVVTMLENALGIPADSIPSAIDSDPVALEKIKQLEILAGYDAQNTQNARANSGNSYWIISGIAVAFITFFAIFTVLMLCNDFADKDSAHRVFDTLSVIISSIISYYFGSCHPQNK